MDNEDHVKDFLSYITIIRQSAKNTIECYRRDVEKLMEFMNLNDIEKFSHFHGMDYLKFIKHLDKTLDKTSVRRTLYGVRNFFDYMRVHYNEKNMFKIDSTHIPSTWKKVPIILSQEEVKDLLDSNFGKSKGGSLIHTIMEVLYSTGMRISELCNLRIEDVNFSQRTIHLKNTKDRSERIVIIGKSQLKLVKKHWAKCNRIPDKSDFFLVNTRGKQLNRNTIWRSIKNVAKRLGIKKKITPHTFRHCFASHMLENGADLRVIQQMLGHSGINNTEIYLHISPHIVKNKFEDAHFRFNPMAMSFITTGMFEAERKRSEKVKKEIEREVAMLVG